MSVWLCSDHIIALYTPLLHTHTHTYTHANTHPQTAHIQRAYIEAHSGEFTQTYLQNLDIYSSETHTPLRMLRSGHFTHAGMPASTHTCVHSKYQTKTPTRSPTHTVSTMESECARDTDVQKGRGEKR